MKRMLIAVTALLLSALVLPPLWYVLFPRPVPALPPPGRRIEVSDGLSVNVIEEGSGPPVLLVHGHPGSAYDWTLLMAELSSRGYRAVAYDRVGYGRSDGREPGDITVETNAAELLRLLEALGLSEVTLVGWSYGGGASILAAKRDPSRIARLALVGSVGPGIELREGVPTVPDWVADLIVGPVFAWISSVPPLSDRVFRVLGRAAFHPDPVPEWFRAHSAANLGRSQTQTTLAAEGRDLGGEADLDPSPIDLPILVVQGVADRLVPLFVAETLHERARRSEIHRIPDSGHMLPVTHPALLAALLQDFAASQ